MGVGAAVAAAAASVAAAGISAGVQAATAESPQSEAGGGRAPLADPLISGISNQALAALGITPDPLISTEGSPFQSALQAALNQNLLRRGEVSRLQKAFFRQMNGDDRPADRVALETLSGAVGLTVQQLMDAQLEFGRREVEQLSFQQQIADASRATAITGAEGIQNLIQNLPQADAQALDELTALHQGRIERDVNRFADEASLGQIRQANAANFNPGRPLGDIEEARLRSLEDSFLQARGAAASDLSARQGLAANEAQLLMGIPQGPTNTALQLAAIRAGAEAQTSLSVNPGKPPIDVEPISTAGSDTGTAILAAAANKQANQRNNALIQALGGGIPGTG
jgi:hypothetical protein